MSPLAADPGTALGFSHFIAHADTVGKTLLAVLVAMSALSWYLIAVRGVAMSLRKGYSARFLTSFRNASTLNQVADEIAAQDAPEPFSRLTAHALHAQRHHARYGAARIADSGTPRVFLARTIKRALDERVANLERALSALATVAATASLRRPVRHGTGVDHALVATGVSNASTRDRVAAPVREALIITGVGLAVVTGGRRPQRADARQPRAAGQTRCLRIRAADAPVYASGASDIAARDRAERQAARSVSPRADRVSPAYSTASVHGSKPHDDAKTTRKELMKVTTEAQRLVAAVATTLATFADAQTPSAPVVDAITLPSVVVRGEKIARDLKDTTTSVGLVDSDRVESTGVRTLPDAFRLLGNVRDADFIDSGILIRGINSEGVGGPAGRPLASVYIDGVAQTDQGVRRGASGLWDVEQVEVLRGPQSTTSGRNALAGTIRLQTKDPTFHWERPGQLRLGDHEQRGLAAVVSGPLSPTVAFRVAGEYAHARGFVDYPLYDGLPLLDRRRDDDYHQIRGKLLWQPAGARGARVLLSHATAYDSPSYDDVDGPSAGVDWFDRKWGAQSLPVFVEARSTRNASTALDASIPLGSNWRLASVTTRVRSKTDRSSVDRASVGLITQTEVAQELRLNYDAGRMRGVFGLYANRESFQDDRDQVRPFQPTVLRRDRRSGSIDNDALFGEVNRTAGKITWIVGARYDRERQDASTLAQRLRVVDGSIIASTLRTTFASYDALLPKVGASWQLDPTQSVGLVVQRGYRAGGAAFNTVTAQTYSYEPEFANNFELSYRLFSADRRLRLNANLFEMRWMNQQVNVPQIPGDFTSDVIVNAGSSRVRGGEIELQARPVPALDLFASVGVAQTQFLRFEFVQFGAPLNLAGQSFPQAPDFSAAVGGQWKHGGWFVGGDVKYTGTALSRSVFEGLPADRMPAYTVANLRTGYAWPRARLSLYIDNAFDEKYFLYRFDRPSFQVGTVGKGRRVGLELYARY